MADSPNFKPEQYGGNELPCRRSVLSECSCLHFLIQKFSQIDG